jgi:serine/threonine-protein kinase
MESKLGKYEVRAVLAHGATGTVYEAWDPDADRKVVIRTIDLVGDAPADDASPDTQRVELYERLEHFRREARATKGLQHPNILTVYDYGETEALAYTVLEYVDGTTLEARLQTAPPISADDTVQIIADVLAALQYCHDRGIVHRDVKPGSIVLTRRGTAKITDFSLAYVQGKDMVQPGAVQGTPGYVSPEQLLGQPVDARSDIYAAGAVLFQMLTGVPPFDGSPAEIRDKLLHGEPPLPSSISPAAPPALDPVAMRALARQPGARFSSAAAFAVALRGAACGATIVLGRTGALAAGTMPEPLEEPLPRRRRRRFRSRTRRRVAALLAMTLGGTAILYAGGYIGPRIPGTASLTPNPGTEAGQGTPTPASQMANAAAPPSVPPRDAAPAPAPAPVPAAATSNPTPPAAPTQAATAQPGTAPAAPPAAAPPPPAQPAAAEIPPSQLPASLPPPPPIPAVRAASPPTPSTGRAHMPASADRLPLPPAPPRTVPPSQRRLATRPEPKDANTPVEVARDAARPAAPDRAAETRAATPRTSVAMSSEAAPAPARPEEGASPWPGPDQPNAAGTTPSPASGASAGNDDIIGYFGIGPDGTRMFIPKRPAAPQN